jgi:tetratricopeptide (TPR) repeat protein
VHRAANASQTQIAATLSHAEALLRGGRLHEARRLFESLLTRDFRRDFVLFRLGVIADLDNRLEDAIGCFQLAIQIAPRNPELLYALGRAHKKNNDFVAAERCYRDALRARPDFTDVLISLGILLRNWGNLAEAELCYRQALRLSPHSFPATLNLGNVLLAQDRFEEAIEHLRRALELEPGSAEANNNLGRALLRSGEAIPTKYFFEALRLKPDYFEAADGLGDSLMQSGSYEDAAAAFSIARDLRSESTATQIKFADACLAAGRIDDAVAEYEKLLREQQHRVADVAAAQGGLAAALALQGQYETPRALFEESLRQEPDSLRVKQHYALFLLRHGDYAAAWPHYEARRKRTLASSYGVNHDLGTGRPVVNQWQGEDLSGKTLLIACEQGLGDEIMFASLFQEMLAQAGRCIIECDQRLAPIFRRSFANAVVLGIDRNASGWRKAAGVETHSLPAFDCWSPAGSLPRFLRTSAENFPQHQGYLRADPLKVARWRACLADLGPQPKIGISWRGGKATTRTVARSLTLDQLRVVLATESVQFVNLQYGDCREEIRAFEQSSGIRIHHWQQAIDDYDETAALVSALDRVVSVCTAVIHLCGALNRPVWVMAPRVAEWRYGYEGQSMIWYPSVRMYRQSEADAWEPVVAQVSRDLREVRSTEQ